MLDLIRKGILAGIGAAVVTAEKVQEATRKLVQEGRLSTDEAEKLAEDLVKSGEQQWQELNNKVTESTRKFLESVDLVRSKELNELAARVEMIEQRLAALEQSRQND